MNERQIPRWAMAALALVVLFGLGSLLYNAGWSSGMATGLLAANSESGALNPYLLSRMGGMHGGIGFFGGLLRIGFFLIFLAVIARVFGFMRWRMHQHNGGEAAHAFHGHWGGAHGWRHWEQPTASAQPAPAPAQPASPVEKPAEVAPTEPPAEKM